MSTLFTSGQYLSQLELLQALERQGWKTIWLALQPFGAQSILTARAGEPFASQLGLPSPTASNPLQSGQKFDLLALATDSPGILHAIADSIKHAGGSIARESSQTYRAVASRGDAPIHEVHVRFGVHTALIQPLLNQIQHLLLQNLAAHGGGGLRLYAKPADSDRWSLFPQGAPLSFDAPDAPRAVLSRFSITELSPDQPGVARAIDQALVACSANIVSADSLILPGGTFLSTRHITCETDLHPEAIRNRIIQNLHQAGMGRSLCLHVNRLPIELELEPQGQGIQARIHGLFMDHEQYPPPTLLFRELEAKLGLVLANKRLSLYQGASCGSPLVEISCDIFAQHAAQIEGARQVLNFLNQHLGPDAYAPIRPTEPDKVDFFDISATERRVLVMAQPEAIKRILEPQSTDANN